MNWRLILTRAFVLGVLAGIIPIFFTPDVLFTTLPVAMMFGIYIAVPKAEDKNRLLTGVTVSLIAALVALTAYFAYQYIAFGSDIATANLKVASYNVGMSVLMISLIGSWLFTKVHNWTEKKRAQMEAKMAAKKETEKKRYAGRPKRKVKKKKRK